MISRVRGLACHCPQCGRVHCETHDAKHRLCHPGSQASGGLGAGVLLAVQGRHEFHGRGLQGRVCGQVQRSCLRPGLHHPVGTCSALGKARGRRRPGVGGRCWRAKRRWWLSSWSGEASSSLAWRDALQSEVCMNEIGFYCSPWETAPGMTSSKRTDLPAPRRRPPTAAFVIEPSISTVCEREIDTRVRSHRRPRSPARPRPPPLPRGAAVDPWLRPLARRAHPAAAAATRLCCRGKELTG